jgi:hypothetical protein
MVTVYQNMSENAIEKYILEKFVIKKQSAVKHSVQAAFMLFFFRED